MGQDIVTKPLQGTEQHPRQIITGPKSRNTSCQTLQVLLVTSHSKPIWEACFSRLQLHRRDYTIIPQKTFWVGQKVCSGFISPEWTFGHPGYFYKTGGGFLTTISMNCKQGCQSHSVPIHLTADTGLVGLLFMATNSVWKSWRSQTFFPPG